MLRSRLTLVVGLGLIAALLAPADHATALAPPDIDPAVEEPEEEPPPTWRFRETDRPVKVMILAGSVGAWQRDPYHQHFENWCANVEVKNLSKTGYGAYALRKRFMDQVVANGWVNLRAPEYEYWIVFQGGLNSVAMPEKTNKEIRQLNLSAHQRGVEVVALSLSPWGDESDSRRWKGLTGLTYKRYTETVVDFELGRSSPREALGRFVDVRDDPNAPWDGAELADVGIDLYDSPLRDREAPLRDVAKMRAEVEKSKEFKQRFAGLDETTRALALDEHAQRAAELPRWYLREELRSFDHIHPNEYGHRLIAEIACPQLPASWGCECPAVGSGPKPPAPE
jgi:hypothetical protein